MTRRMRDYPPLGRHGVIGDRRSAALVAADGSVSWWCVPRYDSPPVFGALLDDARGGRWRLGPADDQLGAQRYRRHTTTLLTAWSEPEGCFELADTMVWPETSRRGAGPAARVLVRCLMRSGNAGTYDLRFAARDDFGDAAVVRGRSDHEFHVRAGARQLRLWCSEPLQPADGVLRARGQVAAGAPIWAVLALDCDVDWSAARARAAVESTERFWSAWVDRLAYRGPRRTHVRRSAITFHLLGYAPTGALVAAPTTSLPERVGGERNHDYRYSWVRDVSLALAILSVVGDLDAAERYMDWLAQLGSEGDSPLQVLYRVDGGMDLDERERRDLDGYRGSRPVRYGNRAARQHQIDGLGYLADYSLIYLQQGGRWKPEYWDLVRRCADYVAGHWREPGNGIWELDEPAHFTVDKVMSWVTLERAGRIARWTRVRVDLTPWHREMRAIRAEVLERGWSDARQSFRQRYDDEALDASVLLMAMMNFLPAHDPKMCATIERIDERLCRGGGVYRFEPGGLPGSGAATPAEIEGAFLPCTFWLAAAYAMLGRTDEAEALLTKIEATAGDTGLFAEEIDPETGGFLGNTLMIFSHAEYVKAVMELAKARPLQHAQPVAGVAYGRVRRMVSPSRRAE